MHILPCCVSCHHQESHLSILCMLAVLVVAALSISRGVSSFEKVNWVMVPTLLLSVVFSFYWAIFLPYASQGIVHLFTPDWGRWIEEELSVEEVLHLYGDRGLLSIDIAVHLMWYISCVFMCVGFSTCYICMDVRRYLGALSQYHNM